MEKAFRAFEIGLKSDSLSIKALYVVGACLLLSLLAQVRIPLGFTPVPITGQTFGVAFIALIYGRNLAFTSIAGYLALGGLGLPVFQGFTAGLVMGPSLGYLIGMIASASLIGYLSDCGYAKTFKSSFVVCYLGSILVFAFGSLGLSFFVPWTQVFSLGVLPFLIGDFIKNAAAAGLATSIRR